MKNLDKLKKHINMNTNNIKLCESFSIDISFNIIMINYYPPIKNKTTYLVGEEISYSSMLLPHYIIELLQSRNKIKMQLALNLL